MQPIEFIVTVHPEAGAFTPTSFQELVGHPINLPGLDPAFQHTLISATAAPDGSSVTLRVHTEHPHAHQLVRHLLVDHGAPAAHVKAFGPDGEQLAEGRHAAPLRDGQPVEVDGARYVVSRTEWPLRDPETGTADGHDIDWQHAHLTPAPATPSVPVPAILNFLTTPE